VPRVDLIDVRLSLTKFKPGIGVSPAKVDRIGLEDGLSVL